MFASSGLSTVSAKLQNAYYKVFAETTFFWIAISGWVWCTLIFGNHGKYKITKKQPWAGLYYFAIAVCSGIGGFLILHGTLGIWFKTFNMSVLLSPSNAEEVHLAIEGLEASNFYVLPVIICQIPLISLFEKFPWRGNIKQPYESVGAMMSGTVIALFVWLAVFVPSFLKFKIGTHDVISGHPFGSWPAILAFCQGFIFWFLLPVEGMEGQTYKGLGNKQPYKGFAGLIAAFVIGGFVWPRLIKAVAAPFFPSVNPWVVSASVELTMVIFMLLTHHLFDDAFFKKVKNIKARVWSRFALWVVGGFILGILWLFSWKIFPFGGNNLGLGVRVMGPLAGQFAFLMAFLYCNTFFDKWPMIKQKIQ
jgi:AAT family amino acid transporter